MGEGFYYVANQQEFEDVLVECPVSLHLTGHTHRELLTRVNRRDQLEAAAVKVDAAYYELTGSVRELVVTRVDIPDLDAPTDVVRTELTTYDLRPDRGRDRALPKKADVTLAGDSVDLDVAFTGTFSGSVDAVLYDTSIYAGRNDELAWSALERRKHRFTGQLDGSALPPGAQRVHVRVVPEDDSGNRLLTVPVARTSDPVSWRSELEGSIQGGATVVSTGDEELLVVGDSSGRVTALDDAGRARWSSRVEGEVRHDLVPIGDRSRVAVPDSAGYVHLFGPDGEPGHRYATDAPLSGDPGCGWVDDTEVLMVCAGTTLHLVETSTGDQLWTADLPAPSMGAPATDGDRVFIGAGDGRAHALDARTGSLLWSTSVTDKEGSYQRFIYGPWNDAVIVLPDGGVIISGIADARCLEPADGSVRWSLDGSFQYAREAVTEDGDLVMADEAGEIVVLDPTSGTAKARHATAERILDEGFVLSDGVVYAASHSGLISAVDLASGEIEHLARLGAAPVLAPGTVFGEDVVFGDLAGTVHAVPMI
jgi:outer membrane protein assembly factor BamB